MRGEGHIAAGWGIGGSVYSVIAADCGSKVCSFGQWAAAVCVVLPTANAGQYTTSNCKPLMFGFPFKWRYVNVRTFNILTFDYKL